MTVLPVLPLVFFQQFVAGRWQDGVLQTVLLIVLPVLPLVFLQQFVAGRWQDGVLQTVLLIVLPVLPFGFYSNSWQDGGRTVSFTQFNTRKNQLE